MQVGIPTCIPDGHLHRVTYTRCIDTIDSPDDEHMAARNMQRTEINIKENRIVDQVGYLQGKYRDVRSSKYKILGLTVIRDADKKKGLIQPQNGGLQKIKRFGHENDFCLLMRLFATWPLFEDILYICLGETQRKNIRVYMRAAYKGSVCNAKDIHRI